MKKVILFVMFFLILPLCSCGSNDSVKILVKNISMGGTGDNYVVSPVKVEVTGMGINKVTEIPITISNNDNQEKTYQLKVVPPLNGEASVGYTPYPVSGIGTFFSQDTINIEGGKTGVVKFYIAKVDKIPNIQLWVNVSVETGQQLTSAYMVNILIKGDKNEKVQ